MKTLKDYHVEWEMTVKAESPLHAAMDAPNYITKYNLNTFAVTDDTGYTKSVNLAHIAETYPLEEWQAAVAAGETRLGYTDWVEKKLEEE